MAASDQNYRNQHTLDIVFAVSSLAMLASVIWMFVDDYNRPYKVEQRDFRTVESALAQRQAVEQIPNKAEFEQKEKAFESARAQYNSADTQQRLGDLKREIATMRPDRERADADFQAKKADVESTTSFYNIAQERNDTQAIKEYTDQLRDLTSKLAASQAKRDEIAAKMKEKQIQVDAIEQPLTKAQSEWKKVTDKFDTQVKLAYNKQWGWGDWFRALPILDAFASPVKIQQITNNDIPIDYNFKLVTRYDRCATCHLGIDRPAYTRANLRSLIKVTPDQQKRLDEAHALLAERSKAYEGLPEASRLPTANQLTLREVPEGLLTDSRVTEYAAHPRLDLFVGANSKHPMEKFGCSACHYGQGSATEFTLAAHTPNNAKQKEQWEKEHDWEAQHMWDFPMLPQRFVESSCLKCHYEVTDLIASDNRIEAPKLIRGYNLIKDNGCYGCHEIAGTKGGRQIGPDLRLEPSPTLDTLSPAERSKIETDPENPPGNLRKVGPSLFRLSEKTNFDWTVKWIRAPRSFRPDTKMPHFYGLSNNHPDVLPPDQKGFPDAEIRAIAYYLFEASDQYVREIATQHAADQKGQEAAHEEGLRLADLLAKGKERLSDKERTELDAIRRRVKLRSEKVLTDLAPDHAGDAAKGRQLFTERGCLACHSHEGTTAKQGDKGGKDYVPAVHGEALFGPNLSQVAAKLGKTPGDKKSARVWLVQWITNPNVHSPRTRMPITHLTAAEAADVAAWLLAQPPTELGADWQNLTVAEPDRKEYEKLARVYLTRLLPGSDIESFFQTGTLNKELASDLPQEERQLAEQFSGDKDASLKRYLGKKAVGRLGCYACHDVPGFENAKPIGVALNDWGKKDPARLAFENIDNFVEKHFYPTMGRTDPQTGKPYPPKVVKEEGHEVTQMPYERFFYDSLLHRQRMGYLNQKILEPRSYDHAKQLAWDDRSRMPQFRFARGSRKNADESDTDYEARSWKEEGESREAVMTFVLGLVAEQVPEKMVNHPKGDRLMEVKGRQVLDKYNCAGCHLLRPGAYDLQVKGGALKELQEMYEFAQNQNKSQGIHVFPAHHFWTGKSPATPDRVVVPGVYPRAIKKEEDEDEPDAPYGRLQVVLAEALRFTSTDANSGTKTAFDIPASIKLKLPLEDLIPGIKTVKSPGELDALLSAQSPWGGRFSNLMVPYLADKNPETVRLTDGDSGQARASLPPPLIGQGDRTQPQWLYQFLLEPTAVRRMSILRMPKFNLSPDEARVLVDYFAAVEKITNPSVGLSFPGVDIPQQAALDSPYWEHKNREYVARLKSGSGQDAAAGYKERLKDYEGSWRQVAKRAEAILQADIDKVKQQSKENAKQIDALQEKLKKVTEPAQKTALEKQVAALKDFGGANDEAAKKLEEELKQSGPEAFKTKWQMDEAYVADAYRLIANRKVCLQCHQVGAYTASNPVTQGPPLALVHERLRPEWLYRWIAIPQRHLPYESVMPPYFPKPTENKPAEYQNLFAGRPLDQIEAVRDTLMNFPRVLALPIDQQHNPNIPNLATIGEKK